MTLEEALRRAHKAYRRLEKSKELGPVGRRNARKLMIRAVDHMLAAMDVEYPRIKAPPAPRKVRTPIEQRRALKRRGWQDVVPPVDSIVEACAIAGIQLKANPITSLGSASTMAPSWTIQMLLARPKMGIVELGRLLLRCKKDRGLRAQILSEDILKVQEGA